MGSIFFRLLDLENKGERIRESINMIIQGDIDTQSFIVNPDHFSLIPTTPFSYWISEDIRGKFKKLDPFENENRTAKQGLATADDFRFLRLWWEVSPYRIVSRPLNSKPEEYVKETYSKRWVLLTKGGEYSPYYTDIHLLVNWEKNGNEIKSFINPDTKKPYSRPQNLDYYFKKGITWQSRPLVRGSFSFVPEGVIFSHTGTMVFSSINDEFPLCSILNSDAYIGLLHVLMPRGGGESSATLKYEVGYVKAVPIPSLNDKNIITKLNELAIVGWNLIYDLHRTEETSINFLPDPIKGYQSLKDSFNSQICYYKESEKKFFVNQTSINKICFKVYSINESDIEILTRDLNKSPYFPRLNNPIDNYVNGIFSLIVGVIFGRWDIRLFIEVSNNITRDPNAPLPICSPAMLKDENDESITTIPTNYPIEIDSDGILVDDFSHQDDILKRVGDLLQNLWREDADNIEKEACDILNIKTLRLYFRKTSKGGFWDDHLKRYSKSRRKAPIYWLLQSEKKNYAVWLYYHRYDHDTLFKVLERYVKPKVNGIERHLDELTTKKTSTPQTDPSYKKILTEIEEEEDLLAEINRFADKIQKVADLSLVPDLDDGVVLTAAPLWEVIPWKELADYWKELLEGKYEWSSIGKQLREKGLVKG